jgi:hypothetical protein
MVGILLRVTLIVLLLACDPAILAKAAARAEAFDLRGALDIVRTAGACDEAGGAAEYAEGLLGGADAVEHGGTADSLREVRSAANALSRRSEQGDRRWEAASLALRAVAATSQQERSEMAIYLAEAARIEGLLIAARLPGVPFITVHELAGDLWLQVHQFADARTAYLRAASLVGQTPRVKLGLARTADRLNDPAAACDGYRSVLEWWDSTRRTTTPPEIENVRSRTASLCHRR